MAALLPYAQAAIALFLIGAAIALWKVRKS